MRALDRAEGSENKARQEVDGSACRLGQRAVSGQRYPASRLPFPCAFGILPRRFHLRAASARHV